MLAWDLFTFWPFQAVSLNVINHLIWRRLFQGNLGFRVQHVYGHLCLVRLTVRTATFTSRVKILQMLSVWSKITDINMSQFLKILESFSKKANYLHWDKRKDALTVSQACPKSNPITRPTSSAFERLSLEKKKTDGVPLKHFLAFSHLEDHFSQRYKNTKPVPDLLLITWCWFYSHIECKDF